MKKLCILFCCAVSLTPLFADQFAYIEPDLAKRAAKLLEHEAEIYIFCEPCSESHGQIEKVYSIETADVNFEGYHEVRINGKGIDLAYTFIKRDGKWKNAAFLLGLIPSGVSREVSVR